jgi:hypothetical protein
MGWGRIGDTLSSIVDVAASRNCCESMTKVV